MWRLWPCFCNLWRLFQMCMGGGLRLQKTKWVAEFIWHFMQGCLEAISQPLGTIRVKNVPSDFVLDYTRDSHTWGAGFNPRGKILFCFSAFPIKSPRSDRNFIISTFQELSCPLVLSAEAARVLSRSLYTGIRTLFLCTVYRLQSIWNPWVKIMQLVEESYLSILISRAYVGKLVIQIQWTTAVVYR